MDPTEKEKVLKALSALGVDAESLGSFDDEALEKLSAAKYNTLGILRSARSESLEVLLAPAQGLVDCILKAQGTAAGLGLGSAARAGTAGERILPQHKAREKVLGRYFVCDTMYSSVFTPISSKVLATHYHGKHAFWQPGQTLEVLVNDDKADKQQGVQAKVLAVHPNLDVIFLTVEKDLEAPDLDMGVVAGTPYMMLGCSNRSQKRPFSVSHGIISTTIVDENGFIRGDSVSLQGDSGAGCFSSDNGKLFAMNVASDAKHGNRAVLVSIATLLPLAQSSGAPIPAVAWGEGS